MKGASVETLASKYLDEFVDIMELFSDKQFDLDYPELYERRNSEWVAIPHVFGDVYDLLSWYGGGASLNRDADTDLDGFVLVTCGWASPLQGKETPDMPPSQHPDRRRMSLVYVAGCDGSLDARLIFQDGETVDGMNGTGSLLDAMETTGACVWKKEWVRGVFARYGEWRAAYDRAMAGGDDLEGGEHEGVAQWYASRVAHLMQVFRVKDLQGDESSDSLPLSEDN